jgi:hypothetical protein
MLKALFHFVKRFAMTPTTLLRAFKNAQKMRSCSLDVKTANMDILRMVQEFIQLRVSL